MESREIVRFEIHREGLDLMQHKFWIDNAPV